MYLMFCVPVDLIYAEVPPTASDAVLCNVPNKKQKTKNVIQ